jgi:HlyD family secretion protein
MARMSVKRRKWFIAGACLLAVLVAAGVIRYNMIEEEKARSLEEVSLETEEPEGIVAWGEVKYEKVYDINIDFPCQVTDIKVKEGERVSLGQELVTLDLSEYTVMMDKLREQLRAGEAGLKTTRQDTAALSADIAQIRKDIKTKTEELNKGTSVDLEILQRSLVLAKKELENAKKDVRDQQELYEAGSISEDILEQYRDILDQREKAVADIESNIRKTRDALKSELDQLDILLKSKQSQLEQTENSNSANTEIQDSGVETARIDLKALQRKSAKDYLDNGSIVSCVKNGIVQNIGVVNGTMLGAQSMPTRVLQLIDADTIMVSAEVDEEFIKDVALGGTANIVPASDSSLSIPGVVTHISNMAVEKDGKRIVKVEVKPQDPEGELKPGYSADVYFPGN